MSRPFGAKANMLAVQEKEKLVNDHIKNDLTFRELSIKYKVSYSSARKYCINYIESGPSTLINNTGKHTKGSLPRTNSLDPKDREIALLKKKLKEAEMEIEARKKLHKLMNKNNQ